jgi:prepilin-type N-terminal cleavage/methylation domain-containing protein
MNMDMKKNISGITLIELVVVLAIFSVVMAGLYSSYSALMQQGVKEFRRTASSVETEISAGILERDIMMAGYGLAEDYSMAPTQAPLPWPRAAQATEGGVGAPDTLTLMGTAIGMNTRAAQGWTYVETAATGVPPTFKQWADQREDVNVLDAVLIMEPSTKKLLTLPPSDCFFIYNGNNNNVISTGASQPYTFDNAYQQGTVLYGLYSTATPTPLPTQPMYAVRYYTTAPGANLLSSCEPNTMTLFRAESRRSNTPGNLIGESSPLFNCVLDFQVAFGLDTDENGDIDTWDNGGVVAQTYGGVTGPKVLNRRLKQIRVYILAQEGTRDATYTYSNPDPAFAPGIIRVGDLTLTGGVGRNITLTAAQRNYRWKVHSFALTPRNVR